MHTYDRARARIIHVQFLELSREIGVFPMRVEGQRVRRFESTQGLRRVRMQGWIILLSHNHHRHEVD